MPHRFPWGCRRGGRGWVLMMGVNGWYSAIPWSQPGSDSMGTNPPLSRGRIISSKGKLLAVSGLFAASPNATDSQASAKPTSTTSPASASQSRAAGDGHGAEATGPYGDIGEIERASTKAGCLGREYGWWGSCSVRPARLGGSLSLGFGRGSGCRAEPIFEDGLGALVRCRGPREFPKAAQLLALAPSPRSLAGTRSRGTPDRARPPLTCPTC
jgi:hypothetical protein